MWNAEVEEAVLRLLAAPIENVRRACVMEILGPQLPAEVSAGLPPYLAALCSLSCHHHPSGAYTDGLPEVFEECSDDAGGADYVDFEVLSALARDVSSLTASACNSFAAVKPRVLVQSLLKGHTMLVRDITSSIHIVVFLGV